MSREDIIKSITNDNQYLDYCKYICKGKDVYKDLYQYVMLYICELPDTKLQEVWGGNVKAYVKRIIYANANYKNAPFYQKYIKGWDFVESDLNLNAVKAIDDTEDDKDYERWKESLTTTIETVLEDESKKSEGYAWKVELFKLYLQIGTYRQVAFKTDIPRATVRLRVLELVDKIKEYNENFNNNQ